MIPGRAGTTAKITLALMKKRRSPSSLASRWTG
jgi:hypothetical protein